jgi:ectoine hydroxylase-related dioxygenase (phytanoyl-CoA dioxygenase family)
MSYRYTEQNREEYLHAGFTILRGLIPAALLADLRRETDRAREIARTQHGAQAQRLQPVYSYPELNPQPFRDFLNLPELRKTVDNILGADFQQTDNMGVLLEPAEKPWTTHWHRDWGYNVDGMDLEQFFEAAKNWNTFNQFNAALYDDHSLWAVPGSQNREDTEEERRAFPHVPPPGPEFTETMTLPERELTCSTYARKMPGAVPVALLAGDCAFYRASIWHIGVYIPYTKRATLHDNFFGPDDLRWQEAVKKMRESRA